MSESEVKKCPKCSGEMEVGYLDGAYNWQRGRSYLQLRPGPRIFAYACKNCGYVEFYIEKR
jgi:hypothetical protein